MNQAKRRAKRKAITAENGKGSDGISLRKGLDKAVQASRLAKWVGMVIDTPKPQVQMTTSATAHINPERQERKRLCRLFKCTMKQLRKANKQNWLGV